MHSKIHPALSLLISAAVIAATYTFLSRVAFDLAIHLSVTEWVFQVYILEFIQFACILPGVVVDHFAQKLSPKNRLILSAMIVITLFLIFKFLM